MLQRLSRLSADRERGGGARGANVHDAGIGAGVADAAVNLEGAAVDVDRGKRLVAGATVVVAQCYVVHVKGTAGVGQRSPAATRSLATSSSAPP